MKRLMIKKSIFALGYLVLAVLIEIITFLFMGIGVVPRYFVLDLAVLLMISTLIFIMPHASAQIVVSLFLIFVQIILSITNEALYSMSGTVFGFNMLNLMNEVTGVIDSSFLNWWFISVMILIFCGAVAAFVCVGVKMKVERKAFRRNCVILTLVALFVVYSVSGTAYTCTVKNLNAYADDDMSLFLDESSLYTSQIFPAKAYREFGTFGYYGVNLVNSISATSVADEITMEEIDEYFANGKMSNDVYGDNVYTGAISGKNIVLIVIESGEWYAINKEYTPTLYALAEQGIALTDFYARDKTNHSEAMSIMGSYPTVSKLEPDKIVGNDLAYALPNVLGNDGYTTNYFHANTGSYYNRDEFFEDLYGFDNTYYLEDMPLLKGYASKKNFYDFDKDSQIFDHYYEEFTYSENGPFYTQLMTLTTHGKYTDLIDYGNYPFTDVPSARGEKSVTYMSGEELEKFSGKCEVKGLEEYYALIDSFPSTYVTGTKGVDEEYLEETGLYSEMFLRYKRFQAGMTDLDFGVNMLVNDLLRDGKLDDTLFVFYADHSAYYNQQNYIMKGVDSAENYNTSVYNVPCFMWYGGSMDMNVSALDIDGYESVDFTATKDTNSGLTSQKIDKFTCTFDILPTLLQLEGYNYNTNLFHGTSIFTDEESLFVSHESGIFTRDVYFSTINIYERQDGEWTCYDFAETYTAGDFDDAVIEFINSAKNYYKKQSMIEAVLLNDYFASRNIFSDRSGIKYLERTVN